MIVKVLLVIAVLIPVPPWIFTVSDDVLVVKLPVSPATLVITL